MKVRTLDMRIAMNERLAASAAVADCVESVEHATLFSTRDFISAWCKVFPKDGSPLGVRINGSGPPRTMFAIQHTNKVGVRSIELGPCGFFASPGWNEVLQSDTLTDVVSTLKGVRTGQVIWNVRFDHADLASGLQSRGFQSRPIATHVLRLNGDYQETFSGYNATMRNQVRRSLREGVTVRDAQTQDDVREYYQVHGELVRQKQDWKFVYPIEFFFELLTLPHTGRMLLAEYKGKIIAGGLFYRDGNSIMYAHGSSDREYSKVFPGCAVVDRAIQWACENQASSFNFGSSNGISSLEQFKASWGASVEMNWVLVWKNPILERLANIKRFLRRRSWAKDFVGSKRKVCI